MRKKMCICDVYGLKTRMIYTEAQDKRLPTNEIEHYCSVCHYSFRESIIQPTLEQIVGAEKAAKIRAKYKDKISILGQRF